MMAIKFYFTFFLLLFLTCNNDESTNDVPIENSKLIGQWLLSETYISPGGTTDWQNVEQGYRYIFENEGLFEKRDFNNSLQHNGTFQVKENQLFLYFNNQKVLDTLGFKIEWNQNSLILAPSYPSMCIEECLYLFERD